MAQATTAARTADEGGSGCSLRCECWDCRAWRRHLLRLAALVLLVLGLGGELAWQRGLWRAGAAPPAAPVELAGVAGDADATWF